MKTENICALIEDLMSNGGKRILITFGEDGRPSVGVYPYPDFDDIYQMYQEGKITMNDFREKIGLPILEYKEK